MLIIFLSWAITLNWACLRMCLPIKCILKLIQKYKIQSQSFLCLEAIPVFSLLTAGSYQIFFYSLKKKVYKMLHDKFEKWLNSKRTFCFSKIPGWVPNAHWRLTTICSFRSRRPSSSVNTASAVPLFALCTWYRSTHTHVQTTAHVHKIRNHFYINHSVEFNN